MDEHEFNKWLSVHYLLTRALSGAEVYWIRSVWYEATRRADKRAREECAKVCDQIWAAENTEHGRYIAEVCASAIRDTITEVSDVPKRGF